MAKRTIEESIELLFKIPEEQMLTLLQPGSLWEFKGRRRIYFNVNFLLQNYGYTWSKRSTGSISSAAINGKTISNCSFKKTLLEVEGKYYVDLVRQTVVNPPNDESIDLIWAFLDGMIDRFIKANATA